MRDRGTGSTYQRANGTWAAQLDLGIVDGKRKRVTVYGKTKRIVETKLKALARQLDEHGDLPTSDTTVEKWLTYWLDNIAAKRLKPNTLRSYRTAVTQHIVPAIGKKKVSALSTAHIRQMHDYVIDTLGCSPTTAHNAHRILSVAFKDGVRDGRLSRNIAKDEPAPRKAEPTRTNLEAADARKVLLTAAEDRNGTRWLFALLTGARQSERLGLRWAHLDLELGAADLAWGLQRVSYAHGCKEPCGKKSPRSCPNRRPGVPRHMPHVLLGGNLVLMRPKTFRSTRVVALIEPLRLALIRHRDAMLAETHDPDLDLVWCNPDGSAIDPRQDWQDWRDLLGRAKVDLVTGHEARHTTATLLMEAGASERVVEEILGHSEAVTTRAYQHVSLAMQRKALDALGERLELA